MRLNLPRCDYSDLERISCACPNCDSFTMTDTEHALRSGVYQLDDLKPATQQRYRARTRPQTGPWQFGARHYPGGDTTSTAGTDPVIIDCNHPHDTGICDPCWQDLQICLGDIPALVQELNAAIAKDVRFVPHGHRPGDPETADEDPVMIHLGASSALRHLAGALQTAVPDNGWTIGQAVVAKSRVLLANPDLRITGHIADWATTISQAVVRAHRIIDRPPDLWFYGACPTCGTDLIGERGHTYVACECGYAADLDMHHRAMLTSRQDDKLTVDELVGLFTRAGKPLTRQQVKDLVRRRGLPRERQAKPRWVEDRWGNMHLTATEVWVHRIGDVRDLLDELEQEAG